LGPIVTNSTAGFADPASGSPTAQSSPIKMNWASRENGLIALFPIRRLATAGRRGMGAPSIPGDRNTFSGTAASAREVVR
jgi:hypothetical protein